jgi:hypothetical protein
MTICKRNMPELAVNLHRAIELDIGVNLSPMVVCPVSEQINVFEDFAAQTVGWAAALAEAKLVVARAHAEGRLAVKRVAPDNMIAELERHLLEAKARYADVHSLVVRVRDPGGVVPGYPRPGIIVLSPRRPIPAAYRETPGGAGLYEVLIPTADLVPGDLLTISLSYDLANVQAINLSIGVVVPRDLSRFRRIDLTARPVRIGALARNVTLANYGETSPSGLAYRRPEQMTTAYERLQGEATVELPWKVDVRERVRASLVGRKVLLPVRDRLVEWFLTPPSEPPV